MNVKPIGAFKSGLIRQVVFERRGQSRATVLIISWFKFLWLSITSFSCLVSYT